MSVRAKFTVQSIVPEPNTEITVVNLVPVISGSEENLSFWKYTPAGFITLQITNPSAIEQFKVDSEYYIDFTEAV